MIVGLPLILAGIVSGGAPANASASSPASVRVATDSQEPRHVVPAEDDVTLPPIAPRARGESASPEAPPVERWEAWKKRRLTLEFHLGVATPLGGIGLNADYAFAPWFSFGCGVGTNFIGPEGACMARVRVLGGRRSAMYLGAGVSGGPHAQSEITRFGVFAIPLAPLTQMGHSDPPAPRHWDFAGWANFEVGFDIRWEGGGALRGYLGIAMLLNPGDSTAEPPDENKYYGTVDVTQKMLYAGIALGRAL